MSQEKEISPSSSNPNPPLSSVFTRSNSVLSSKHRIKRVLSPHVNSVPEKEVEEDEEATNEERKKLLKGFDSSKVPASVVDGLEKSAMVKSDDRSNGQNGPNLIDQAFPGNGPLPKIKMALNGCNRRKVFKTPNSFTYRRLLPHLMNIANDTSSVSKIELVDAGTPRKTPTLYGDCFELRSISDNSCAAKTNCAVRQFNDAKPSENRGIEKVNIKVKSNEPELSVAGNELGRTAETVRPLGVDGKGHENGLNCVDASVEENIQTTPPDPGIFPKTEDGYGEECVDAYKLPEKSSSDAVKQSSNTINSTNSVNKTVINPCSRLRLFKGHRSLSYRRLLPFLMDMSKTNSCSSRKPQQKLPLVIPEENRHPAPAASADQDYVNNTAKENHEKRFSEDFIQNFPCSMVPQPASDGSSPGSNNILFSAIPEPSTINNSSIVGPMSVDSVTLHDLGMSKGLLPKDIPQSQGKVTKSQLDLGSNKISSVLEPCSSVNTKQCTSKEPWLVEKQRMCSSMGLELHNGNAESIKLVDLKKLSSQMKASDALVSSNKKNFKGILKRNRRGCRGLCNCLDCASFRLHAERAFEFSRNQLHDAKEVASELMKELVNLRLLLEKSITGNDDPASIRPHPVLIKKACNKALETETLAKESLEELNNDLSVHCRIPVLLQPKVTFAYNI